MKEKIINYIETLEAKAYQSDYYFKQRNDLYIENQNKDKEIKRLNKELAFERQIKKEVREYIEDKNIINLEFEYVVRRSDILEILDKVDKEK